MTNFAGGLRPTVDFRIIENKDTAFLNQLFHSSREWEFAQAAMEDSEKSHFLDVQFKLQSQGYAESFPNAIHRIITLNNQDIGRLIVDAQDDNLRVVDLSILPEFQGRGIGSDVMRGLMAEASGGKVPVRLHVARLSPAQKLYARLGFEITGVVGNHLALEWKPDLTPREF